MKLLGKSWKNNSKSWNIWKAYLNLLGTSWNNNNKSWNFLKAYLKLIEISWEKSGCVWLHQFYLYLYEFCFFCFNLVYSDLKSFVRNCLAVHHWKQFSVLFIYCWVLSHGYTGVHVTNVKWSLQYNSWLAKKQSHESSVLPNSLLLVEMRRSFTVFGETKLKLLKEALDETRVRNYILCMSGVSKQGSHYQRPLTEWLD